ncbi:MAG: efflux RND transporter periplasmic adaptor subunit [Chromatiaceae bacterium]|nr:efflux RND transporter periplasmic adaptor subunit [Chromatiaceae bacterium]
MRILHSAPLLLATLAFLGGGAALPRAIAAPEAQPMPEVGVVEVRARPWMLSTELPGRIIAARIAEVRPQVGGIIQERLFEEGSQIEEGQLLYQIDPALYRAALASAEAELARAQAVEARARLKAERNANLVKSRAVSQEEYDDAAAALLEAKAGVAVAEAALAAARINLDYTQVRAPIAGRIGRSVVTEGALVTANQELALATLQSLDPIYVDLSQSSTQLLRLRRALEDGRLQRAQSEAPRVTLTLEDGSQYAESGRLEFSEVTVDQGTGAVTLRAIFPNPDHLLLPGMFVRARVEEGVRADAILVPQQGVQRDRRGNPSALVVNAENQVEQRELRIDRAVGNHWLIDAGLEAGDRLIVEGVQKVRPGAQVRITPVEIEAPSAGATAASETP